MFQIVKKLIVGPMVMTQEIGYLCWKIDLYWLARFADFIFNKPFPIVAFAVFDILK